MGLAMDAIVVELERQLEAYACGAGLFEDVGAAGYVFDADALAFEQRDRVVRGPAGDLAGDDLVQLDDAAPADEAAFDGPDQLAAFDLRLLEVVDGDDVGALDRRFVDFALGPAVGADG